jgi:Membrane protein required for beta-lactamase induction
MAAIIAILLAVIIDRYAQYSQRGQVLLSIRSASWLNSYLSKCLNYLEKIRINNPYLVILSVFLPLCIGLLLLKLLFGLLFGSIGALLLLTLALFYFLGNRAVGLQTSELVVTHETSFGVLFWFAVLGPTGALLYWFLVISNNSVFVKDDASLHGAFAKLHALAAWIPARITGFIYALVGNFGPGFRCWVNCMRMPRKSSSEVLQECGHAAIDTTTVDDDLRLSARAFIAWVVFSILIVVFK